MCWWTQLHQLPLTVVRQPLLDNHCEQSTVLLLLHPQCFKTSNIFNHFALETLQHTNVSELNQQSAAVGSEWWLVARSFLPKCSSSRLIAIRQLLSVRERLLILYCAFPTRYLLSYLNLSIVESCVLQCGVFILIPKGVLALNRSIEHSLPESLQGPLSDPAFIGAFAICGH